MEEQRTMVTDEELMEELTMANPVDHADVDEAKAEALFERITNEPARGDRHRLWLGRPALAGAALAVAVLAIGGIWIATKGGGQASTPDGGTGPGGSLGLCVEQYDLETLQNREFAFDGTVDGIDGTMVTFRVNQWFRGGEGDSVTLDGGTLLAITPDSDTTLQPGGRYLVAGDETFAWGCGFTREYDSTTAQEWASTLQ